MNLVLIPPVLPCAAGGVLEPIPPWIRVPEIAACAFPVFVAAYLFRLVLAYPGIEDLDWLLASPGTGYGLSPSTAVLLEPPVVSASFSTLWLGADRR